MKRTLLLDGAMGTELQNRGIDVPLPLWSADANIKHTGTNLNVNETTGDINIDADNKILKIICIICLKLKWIIIIELRP